MCHNTPPSGRRERVDQADRPASDDLCPAQRKRNALKGPRSDCQPPTVRWIEKRANQRLQDKNAEVKRVGTIEAVEQLTRYLDFIRRDPAKAGCRGILAAERLKPQAVALAESRGIRCAAVELEVLRGEREPELTLFAA